MPNLSTDLDDRLAIPYFLWDEPMTVETLKRRLSQSSNIERTRLLAKILREARDTDVWKFTTPAEVWQQWGELSKHLGRRREFWKFLLEFWEGKVCLELQVTSIGEVSSFDVIQHVVSPSNTLEYPRATAGGDWMLTMSLTTSFYFYSASDASQRGGS